MKYYVVSTYVPKWNTVIFMIFNIPTVLYWNQEKFHLHSQFFGIFLTKKQTSVQFTQWRTGCKMNLHYPTPLCNCCTDMYVPRSDGRWYGQKCSANLWRRELLRGSSQREGASSALVVSCVSNILLLFWNTPQEIFKKSHKKRWFLPLRIRLPSIALFPNFRSLWCNYENMQSFHSAVWMVLRWWLVLGSAISSTNDSFNSPHKFCFSGSLTFNP